MSGSLLAFFHFRLYLFYPFSAPSMLKWKEVLENFFPLFPLFFEGFLNHLPKRGRTCLLCCRQTLRCREKECVLCYIVMNVLVLETNTLKTRIQTSTPHRYTCSSQWFLRRTSLKIATHRHSHSKTGGSHALVLICEVRMLHPQVVYEIAFSAGLNDLQVD